MPRTLGLYVLGIVLASLAGGYLPIATVLTHRRLQVYLSFASGSMLGAALLHMMPEAVELSSTSVLRWVAVGLLAMYLLERVFSFHQHEVPGDPERPHEGHGHHHAQDHGGRTLSWRTAFLGLAVHTIVGGIALASATLGGSRSAGFGVFLATLLHKPADALTLTSLMLRSGMPRSRAFAFNLAFAGLIPLGAGIFLLGRMTLGDTGPGLFTGAVLAFSAGTFLCISLGDVLPELHFHDHDRVLLSISLLAGCGLMGLAGMFE